MINIGNKEITSIYSGKNAVNGIYCGQKLIWPTTPPTPPPPPPAKKHYLVSFQSEYEDASYDLENPDGGTQDNEFFQEVYESTSDDKIFIAKVVKSYNPNTYKIIDWEYSAFSRHIADDEIKVLVPVIAYGEITDVGECWFRSEIYRTFDNQADADDYVNYIHQNGIDDLTQFEMSSAKDIVYDGTQPYTEFPYTRSVWPPSDPSVDTYNWISEVYDELPKYNEHEVFKNEWLTGTITDSQGQEFDAVFTKSDDEEDYIQFNITSLNGQPIGTGSQLYFMLWKFGEENWWASARFGETTFPRGTNISDRDAEQFNFAIDAGGMTIQFDLTRTSIDPTI